VALVYRELCLAFAGEITVYTQFLCVRGDGRSLYGSPCSKFVKKKRSDLIFRRINLSSDNHDVNHLWKVCGMPPPLLVLISVGIFMGMENIGKASFAEKRLTKGPIPNSRNEHIKSSQVWLWVGNGFYGGLFQNVICFLLHHWFTSQPKRVSEKWNQIL